MTGKSADQNPGSATDRHPGSATEQHPGTATDRPTGGADARRREDRGATGRLALDLACTIRHDGNGGVADDLHTADGLAEWLATHPELPQPRRLAPDGAVPEVVRAEVTELRAAVRALFARAVRPHPPSRADAGRLLPLEQAVRRLNGAAARAPAVPQLRWADDQPHPEPPLDVPFGAPAAADELSAALARSAIWFLAGPDRERLRACTAPRCVRYFVQNHGRQEFCKSSCGNRARAARHYRRHHGGTPGV